MRIARIEENGGKKYKNYTKNGKVFLSFSVLF